MEQIESISRGENMKEDWKNISGERYNWEDTLKPERPYIHDYTKALTMKIYLSVPNDSHTASNVILNFADAYEIIKKIDCMTPGLKKIVYLVGWQYFGHDSKYPAWHEVNKALKRPEDKTALDSFLWLYNKSKEHNTVLSVHINMYDAYQDSPLWDEYVREELLTLNKDGELYKAGIWNGQQAYAVSYEREWESGYAKKRIDELCELLPLKDAGTVHIDAFHAVADVGHNISLERTCQARNKIVRYWRSLGIDVTSEFLYYDTPDWVPRTEQLVGLQPLAFHLSQTLDEYIYRPASLMCATNVSHRYKEGQSALMGNLFGESLDVEGILKCFPDNWEEEFFRQFMLKNMRFLYLNTLERLSAQIDKNDTSAYFSDNVCTHMKYGIIKKGECVMSEGENMFIPSEWHKAGSGIAYSSSGGIFEYSVDEILGVSKTATLIGTRLDTSGLSVSSEEYILQNGILKIDLKPNTAIILERM